MYLNNAWLDEKADSVDTTGIEQSLSTTADEPSLLFAWSSWTKGLCQLPAGLPLDLQLLFFLLSLAEL